MRLSQFRVAVADEFGEAYGRSVTNDIVLSELGGLTAEEALKKGVAAREVWFALCRAKDVPESRWYGVGVRPPKA